MPYYPQPAPAHLDSDGVRRFAEEEFARIARFLSDSEAAGSGSGGGGGEGGGREATQLPVASDLNDLKTAGLYDGTGLIHSPNAGSEWFYVEVIVHSNFTAGTNEYVVQNAWSLTDTANPRVYTRTLAASSWSPWKTIVNRRVTVSVLDYGAVSDGSITASGTGTDNWGAFDAANNMAIAVGGRVIVPPGNYRIGGNKHFGYGSMAEWEFRPGAVLCSDSGLLQRFTCPVLAGSYRIFGDNGTYTGISSVRPEWWGAVRNGSTDDAPAIKKAIACVEDSVGSFVDEYTMTFSRGTYAIGSTIIFTNSADVQWRIRGAGNVWGTLLLAKASFSGYYAVRVTATAGSYYLTDFVLSGLAIVAETQGSGANGGIDIAYLNGYHSQIIEDIRVAGFEFNYVYYNSRLVETRRCSSWPGDMSGVERPNATGFYVGGAVNGFGGDMTFINCQVTGAGHNSGTPTGVGLYIGNEGQSNVTIGGVRFIGFVFYGSGVQCKIESDGSSSIGDIWFTGGCQFEGAHTGSTTAMYMIASGGTSRIIDVHVDGCYMSGWGFFNHIKAFTPASGQICSMWITNNHMANPNAGGAAIDLRGTGGFRFTDFTIIGNEVRDSAAVGGAGMYIEAANNITVNGNSLTGTLGGLTDFIKFNAGGNWHVAQGNNRGGLATNCVTDASGAANVMIGNNL